MAAGRRRRGGRHKPKGGGFLTNMRGSVRRAAEAATGHPTRKQSNRSFALLVNSLTFVAIAAVAFLLVRGCQDLSVR